MISKSYIIIALLLCCKMAIGQDSNTIKTSTYSFSYPGDWNLTFNEDSKTGFQLSPQKGGLKASKVYLRVFDSPFSTTDSLWLAWYDWPTEDSLELKQQLLELKADPSVSFEEDPEEMFRRQPDQTYNQRLDDERIYIENVVNHGHKTYLVRQVIIVKHHKVYQLYFEALSESFEVYQNTWNDLIASFKVL